MDKIFGRGGRKHIGAPILYCGNGTLEKIEALDGATPLVDRRERD